MYQPPDWFWSVIEQSKPSLERLAKWLEAASKEEVIQFALAYVEAAEEIVGYWEGPNVDGVQYSEDDTEDLCNWIVSQGRELWQWAVAGEVDLVELAHLKLDSERGQVAEYPEWDEDVSNPAYNGYLAPEYIARAVYRARFGLSLHEELDKMRQ